MPEVTALTGVQVNNDIDAQYAAQLLRDMGVKTVVIKGGHLDNSNSAVCRDWVFSGNEMHILDTPRFATPHTHGTGCTFSACIAAELAKGIDTLSAIRIAKQAISAAISQPIGVGKGCGAVNHWAISA